MQCVQCGQCWAAIGEGPLSELLIEASWRQDRKKKAVREGDSEGGM